MNTERPNILFLLTDMQRYDALGFNGNAVCKTPAIDRIAREGMRFCRAYTPIALCSPARGSLLTGMFPHNHGQMSNMGNFNRAFDLNILDKPAYPQILSDAGYNVGYVGKWHLAREGDSEFCGFDPWHTTRDWNQSVRDAGFDWGYAQEVQRMEWGGDAPFCGRSQLPAEYMQEHWTANRTIDLIEGFCEVDKPFMICSSFFGPHFPYCVPEPYDEMYDPNTVERWINFDEQFVDKPSVQQKEMLRWNASHLTWQDWQKVIATYWGYCTFIDDQVQRVLDALEEAGQLDNTMIVYSSDHGDMLGSHRLFNKMMNMYNETHQIPLAIRWPGVVEPNRVCDDFVSLVDMMPTFLEMAGVDIPDKVDGCSLLPLLRGETPSDWREDIFAEHHGYEPALCTIRMVQTQKWKYIYNPCSEDELYDLESDPGELHNLAPKLGYKHVLRRMKDRMVKWLRDTNDGIVNDGGWQSNSYDLFVSGRER